MLPWFGLHRGQDVQQGWVSGRIGSCCVCRSERISRTCVIWVSVPGNWGIQDMCDLGQCARQLCRGVLMVECMSQDPHIHTHTHTHIHTWTHAQSTRHMHKYLYVHAAVYQYQQPHVYLLIYRHEHAPTQQQLHM